MPHTPGPWELSDENNSHFEIQIGETICSLDRCSPHSDLKYVIERDEMIANGHLIMAAPDLLDVCESTLALLEVLGADPTHPNIIAMKAAIKKATE